MSKCIICGNVLKDEDYSICDNCIQNNITLDNLLSLGKEWTEEITINGFLASYFRGYIEELEDILLEAIRQKYEQEPNVLEKSMKEYFDFDRDCFINWLEEKWNTAK